MENRFLQKMKTLKSGLNRTKTKVKGICAIEGVTFNLQELMNVSDVDEKTF